MAELRIFDGVSWVTVTDEGHRSDGDPHPTYTTDAEATTIADTEIAGHAAIPAAHHAEVTLDTAADVLLGLAGQQIQIDAQNQNLVLAGPSAGASTAPTFRALVDADIPAAIARDAEVATAVTNHEAAADPHAGYLKESDFTGVDFLVGTATGITANEIAVGTTPGGELGNTWASPTVDASHSGSTHAAAQAAAEATAAGALATHAADADPHTGYLKESDYNAKGDLISASANDTPSTVTAGANDTVLMADSAATAGLKWAAPAVPSTQAFGDAAAEGTGDTFTRGDHKHGMPAAPAAERAAASTTPAPIGTAAVGVGVTDARADHVHATGAGVPSTQAFGDVAAAGAGPAAAMTDHKHAMMADPVTAHAAAADPHAGYVLESLLDAKGDIIVASADNTPAKLTVGADDTILMADAAAAAGLKWVAPAAPVAVGTANAAGSSDDFSRASHVHAHEVAHVAHDTVWDAKGDLVVGTAADTAAAVTVGANDTILMADSAQTAGVKWVAPAVPSTQAFGDAAAEGAADTFTRGDHKHAMPTGTAGPDGDIAIDTAGAAGTAGTAARSAHGHEVVTTDAPSGANVTYDAAATAAATGAIARAAHGHRANTSATAGAAVGIDSGAAAGTSGHSPSRDDHVHQVATTDAPSGANVTYDAAATAAATGAVARAAHGHRANTSATAGAAVGIDSGSAAGTSGHSPSRDDHVHQVATTDAPTGANITIDAAATAAATGAVARAAHGHRLNTSATVASTQALGDAAAAGTSGHSPSRDDHLHAMPAAATQAQQETGTDLTAPVTAGRQHFHPSAAKCWGATTGGGTPTLTAGSYNVTSITDTATGRLTVTIGTDFSSASFVGQVTGTAATATLKMYGLVTKAAGTVILESGTAATTLADVGIGYDWCFYGDFA